VNSHRRGGSGAGPQYGLNAFGAPKVRNGATRNERRAPPATPAAIVKFPDGRESVYFYWDDNSGRRAITKAMSNTEGFLKAKELARAEQDKWGS
jgi:hypothetical protein